MLELLYMGKQSHPLDAVKGVKDIFQKSVEGKNKHPRTAFPEGLFTAACPTRPSNRLLRCSHVDMTTGFCKVRLWVQK